MEQLQIVAKITPGAIQTLSLIHILFVRLLNGLYKVQVGAYTKKENAEATVKRLKAAGIVCFITHA